MSTLNHKKEGMMMNDHTALHCFKYGEILHMAHLALTLSYHQFEGKNVT